MMHYHWAVDKYTRIKSLLDDGWEFATREEVKALERGEPSPLTADRILMKATEKVYRISRRAA